MNKLAIVHLYCNGFTDEDLTDFSLKLSNPSTIAQQQKLELFRTRFEVAGSALQSPGMVDRTWVQKNILRLSSEEIKSIRQGLLNDKINDLEVEATQLEQPEGPEVSPGLPPGLGSLPGMGMPSLPPAAGPPAIDDTGPPVDLGTEPDAIAEKNILSINDDEVPIKIHQQLQAFDNMLNEEKEDNNDDNLTEFEKWQKKEQSKYKNKRNKAKHKEDAGIEDLFSRYQEKRSRASVDGLRSEQDKLKASYNIRNSLEEEIDVSEYLNTDTLHQVHLTNSIKSAINQFDKKFGKKMSIISETNSSGEENE